MRNSFSKQEKKEKNEPVWSRVSECGDTKSRSVRRMRDHPPRPRSNSIQASKPATQWTQTTDDQKPNFALATNVRCGNGWKRKYLRFEQIVDAERRRPVPIDAVVHARVHHEPLAEALIRVGMHVGVVERRVHLAAVAAGEREREPRRSDGTSPRSSRATRGMFGRNLPIALPAGAVALARPDSASVRASRYVALPESSRPVTEQRRSRRATSSTPRARTWSTFERYEYSVGEPGTSGRNCEMIASCTSSWNSDELRAARDRTGARRAARRRASLSGLRFGSGDVNVAPVETS